jgi:DNA helicase IV
VRPAVAPLDGTATLLDPPEAKGLEFDAVVVVEPALIAGGTARGLRLLYVALTRAVQELVVVHAEPLPAALAAARR